MAVQILLFYGLSHSNNGVDFKVMFRIEIDRNLNVFRIRSPLLLLI